MRETDPDPGYQTSTERDFREPDSYDEALAERDALTDEIAAIQADLADRSYGVRRGFSVADYEVWARRAKDAVRHKARRVSFLARWIARAERNGAVPTMIEFARTATGETLRGLGARLDALDAVYRAAAAFVAVEEARITLAESDNVSEEDVAAVRDRADEAYETLVAIVANANAALGEPSV